MSPTHNIRLLAIDLDGTLLGHGASVISAANAEALRLAAAAGVEVVPISARAPFGIEYPLRDFIEYRFLVAYNGALIYDRLSKTTLFDQPIRTGEAHQAIQLLLNHHLYISCYIGDAYYVRDNSWESQNETNAQGMAPLIEPDLLSLSQRGVHKLLTLDQNDPRRLQPFYDQAILQLEGVNIVYTSPYSVEMTHQEASKGAALSWLAQKLGFSTAQTMAVGDSFNDLSMFAVAGLSVAVGDAPVEVQRQVHWVAPPVGENGAAATIWRYILDPTS
jgi:Cof subfamily protein (haloacid dehalogenase superfamily)